jgi:mRNA-degrading endonuclease RelE of RelBE toxin-antitoxin system
MAFEILLAETAANDLSHLDARWRSAIRNAIETHLRHEPAKESRSRIKKLVGVNRPQYRLRVNDYRVFYDIDESTVSILAIVAKSDVEHWLSANAEKSDDSNPTERSEGSTQPPANSSD